MIHDRGYQNRPHPVEQLGCDSGVFFSPVTHDACLYKAKTLQTLEYEGKRIDDLRFALYKGGNTL